MSQKFIVLSYVDSNETRASFRQFTHLEHPDISYYQSWDILLCVTHGANWGRSWGGKEQDWSQECLKEEEEEEEGEWGGGRRRG